MSCIKFVYGTNKMWIQGWWSGVIVTSEDAIAFEAQVSKEYSKYVSTLGAATEATPFGTLSVEGETEKFLLLAKL